MALDELLRSTIACPVDKKPLLYVQEAHVLYNPRLQLRYAARDDVPVLLRDQAERITDPCAHEQLLQMAGANDRTAGAMPESTGPVDAGAERQLELRRVRDYFQATWLDYRIAWLSPEVPALHMGYWDSEVHAHRESLNRTNQVLAQRAGIGPGDVVFDAGCGVGGSMKYLEREFGARCIGATISMTQALKARELLSEVETGAPYRITCADFSDMPLQDSSVDVVWTMEALCYDADPSNFLREAHRVLRPGGRLAIWDGFRTARPLSGENEALLHEFTTGWAVDDLSTMSEMCDRVQAAGFDSVEAIDCGRNVARSLRRLNRLSLAARVPAAVLVKAGVRSPIQIANHRSARLQWTCFRRRLWTMGTVTAVKRS